MPEHDSTSRSPWSTFLKLALGAGLLATTLHGGNQIDKAAGGDIGHTMSAAQVHKTVGYGILAYTLGLGGFVTLALSSMGHDS